MESYTVIRANRRTVGLRLDKDGQLVVRAPYCTSEEEIRRIVEKESAWLAREHERFAARQAEHYAALMGVHPTRVTITGARTRFGSCSGRNAISFSWRLMQYPEEAIDYVVVHELAHIRHHDHSAAFYRFIAYVMPDHEARRALLRQ